MLAKLIAEEQWHWYWKVADEIRAITPPETLEGRKTGAPSGRRRVWCDNLWHLAGARAEQLDLTKVIRKPKWKTCPLCSHRFVEDSLPVPLTDRLGFDGLDFCAPCLAARCFQGTGVDDLPREETLEYLRTLADVLQRVPNQGFGEGKEDLRHLGDRERLEVLRLLGGKPSTRRVKELFGSWLRALVEANVLEDGTRRTTRGTQCLAKDGHVCLSLGEKTIDDLLHARGFAHEKEPRYPEGNYRADFAVGDVFIEYFGLAGNADYDARAKLKQRICRKHGIKLISIYPADLVSAKKLENKLLVKLNA
jgi:hypothetical protein